MYVWQICAQGLGKLERFIKKVEIDGDGGGASTGDAVQDFGQAEPKKSAYLHADNISIYVYIHTYTYTHIRDSGQAESKKSVYLHVDHICMCMCV